MRGTAIVSIVAGAVVGTLAAGPAVAGAPMVAKAKEQGFPAKNCQYCHVAAVPKKETFKPEDLNERGQFLAGEKTKQKAKEVNVEWLKEYPGGKEQK